MKKTSSNSLGSPVQYPASLRRLHWLMAFLLLSMIGLGLFMGSLSRGDSFKSLLLNWHLITGLAVLLLAVVRAVLRSKLSIPALPDCYPVWRKRLARSVHGSFYFLMFALPMLGLSVWAVDPFVGGPAIFGEEVWVSNAAGWLHRLHYLSAWLLLGLLIAHVGGALSQDDNQRRIIRRMLP